ncbi:MAG: HEAT repeat domain-containing protein [Actinomycetota bacterium]
MTKSRASSSVLDEADVWRFCTDGYLVISPSSLTVEDHDALYHHAEGLYAEAAATKSPTAHLDILGDNLRARIPLLDRMLTDAAVAGALDAIVGPGHMVHPHSFCHQSSPADQLFHQDGNLPWNERGHIRSHRPECVLLFYYPQAVTLTNGPTQVVPASQYWSIDHERADGSWHPGDRIDRTVRGGALDDDDLAARDQVLTAAVQRAFGSAAAEPRFVTVPAGSVVLAHYDLVHRGSRTTGAEAPRYLYKFHVGRVVDPTPSVGPTPASPAAATWSWLTGGKPRPGGTDLGDRDHTVHGTDALDADHEPARIDAAYSLAAAATSDPDPTASLAELGAGLRHDEERVRRAAANGLRAAGAAGVATAAAALTDERAPVRRAAVGALGHSATGTDAAAVAGLIDAVGNDDDDLVRSNAACSLGYAVRHSDADGPAIVAALVARLDPAAEPDNSNGAGGSRSTVREEAAQALVQAAANNAVDAPLATAVIDAIEAAPDGDRYVVGLLVEALARTPEIAAADSARLLRLLNARRWSLPG